jgi:hypothetical protein
MANRWRSYSTTKKVLIGAAIGLGVLVIVGGILTGVAFSGGIAGAAIVAAGSAMIATGALAPVAAGAAILFGGTGAAVAYAAARNAEPASGPYQAVRPNSSLYTAVSAQSDSEFPPDVYSSPTSSPRGVKKFEQRKGPVTRPEFERSFMKKLGHQKGIHRDGLNDAQYMQKLIDSAGEGEAQACVDQLLENERLRHINKGELAGSPLYKYISTTSTTPTKDWNPFA